MRRDPPLLTVVWCVQKWTFCHLAASKGVIVLDRTHVPGLLSASIWQHGGSVISVDEQFNCTVRQAAEEH